MFQILFNFVFKIIQTLGALITAPIFAIVNPFLSAFGLSTYYNDILLFFQSAFTYVNFFVTLLHIPRVALVGVFTFATTIFTFNVALRVAALVQAIYRTVKKG